MEHSQPHSVLSASIKGVNLSPSQSDLDAQTPHLASQHLLDHISPFALGEVIHVSGVRLVVFLVAF